MQLKHPLILASNSPRRKQLLTDAGFKFSVITKEVDESFSPSYSPYNVPLLLAERKSEAVREEAGDSILITADTVVILDGEILNKPKDEDDAMAMLHLLSGKMHEVVTGVCISYEKENTSFSDLSKVYFNELTEEEISHYVKQFKPLDKAGAYGIQEWIGYIGINSIEGSFFNIMGLPIHMVYKALKRY